MQLRDMHTQAQQQVKQLRRSLQALQLQQQQQQQQQEEEASGSKSSFSHHLYTYILLLQCDTVRVFVFKCHH